MGKKKGNRGGQTPSSVHQLTLTLREESSGRKQTKSRSNNIKSILKKQHLQNLAQWAGAEASIPSLAALFGHRLADCAEAMETPLDPSLFLCQRCETILQPGHNCTIRVVKDNGRVRGHHKKLNNPTQNNVVYTCHFCSYRNVKKGTSKNHMKRPRPVTKLECVTSTPQESTIVEKGVARKQGNDNVEDLSLEKASISESTPGGPVADLTTGGQIAQDDIPLTPLVKTSLSVGEGKGKTSVSESTPGGPVADLTTGGQITQDDIPLTPLVKTCLSVGEGKGKTSISESTPGGPVADLTKVGQIAQDDIPLTPLVKTCLSVGEGKGKTSISESTPGGPVADLTKVGQIAQDDIPLMPLVKTSLSLGEGKGKKRKKRRSGSNQASGTECNSVGATTEGPVSGSSKRRRKSWTTLKEIVENSERKNNNVTNFSIPFFL